MTKALRTVLVAAVALAFAGCADDKIDLNAAGPGKGDSYFVIGISPEQTRVVIAEDGTVSRYKAPSTPDELVRGVLECGGAISAVVCRETRARNRRTRLVHTLLALQEGRRGCGEGRVRAQQVERPADALGRRPHEALPVGRPVTFARPEAFNRQPSNT